jgi:hypothetical protein
MATYICSVISTVDNAVMTNLAFFGDDQTSVVRQAETEFKQMVLNEISDHFNEKDLDDILNDGYCESGNLYICINHPQMYSVDEQNPA